MAIQSDLSTTAFLVNESRRRAVGLSRDVFAEQWIPPARRDAVRALWDDFAREVYPHDDLELALRTRYFLDRLESVAARDEPAFVNIAAGLTSYPFLVSRPCRCLEVDLPALIAFKQERMQELRAAGVLPAREVRLLAADLTRTEDRRALSRSLADELSGRPSLILLEGISYYLDLGSWSDLLARAAVLQSPGSLLAFDYWPPEVTADAVFGRLQRFWSERFGFAAREYNLFGREFIAGIGGYRILETTSVAEQEGVYGSTAVLGDRRNILFECYATLEKT